MCLEQIHQGTLVPCAEEEALRGLAHLKGGRRGEKGRRKEEKLGLIAGSINTETTDSWTD